MFSIRSVSRAAALVVASTALVTASAEAGNGTSFEWSVNGGAPTIFNPDGVDVGGGIYNFSGGLVDVGYSLSWDINTKADPFVSGNIVVVNTGLATQTFSLTILLPVNPQVLPSSLIGGSVSGGVTFPVGGGQLSQVGNTPIWSAWIDGAQVGALLDDGTVYSSLNAGSIALGPEFFGGNPNIPSDPGPAVLNTIAINITFSLSAGAQASFTSVFVVEPIPSPAGLALLGLAGLITGSRRRRA